jgi:hypothetical protein
MADNLPGKSSALNHQAVQNVLIMGRVTVMLAIPCNVTSSRLPSTSLDGASTEALFSGLQHSTYLSCIRDQRPHMIVDESLLTREWSRLSPQTTSLHNQKRPDSSNDSSIVLDDYWPTVRSTYTSVSLYGVLGPWGVGKGGDASLDPLSDEII